MDIAVAPDGARPHDGIITWAGHAVRCAIGRTGVRAEKREGDGATPAGTFALRRVLFRPDRLAAPRTALPVAPIAPDDGWCDDPAHPDYNRPVGLPFTASHEAMWRTDGLYDVVVVIAHNDDPPVPGLGSAVFVHVATADFGPTAGCVALARDDLLRLLADCAPGDRLVVTI
jgi:L,D-peptidoglycan transpeptidase YkuD (ErfK/YbiS/YcfS/YnhG family)